METNFEQLVTDLHISPISTDVFHQVTLFLKRQTGDLLVSFISQSFQSLLILERWVWQHLSQESHQWINKPYYLEMLHALTLFNREVVFISDNIENMTKASLLFPETIDQVNRIFKQIEKDNNDHDPYIAIVSMWLDNLSLLLQECPQLGHSPIIIHINQYIEHNFIMSKLFKVYLTELQQSQRLTSIFTAKQLFYMKTCSFSLNAFFYTKPKIFPIANQILEQLGNDYLQMIKTYSYTVESWSKELLTCITHLTGFICACCWCSKNVNELIEIFFPTEEILCEYVQSLVRIIAYEPFRKEVTTKGSNDETMLLNSTLFFLLNIAQTQNINWFFCSVTQLPDILMKVAETSVHNGLLFYVYSILGEILTDEKLKELKFTDSMADHYFDILEKAWRHPLKTYQQISISLLLRAFLSLSKNDFIPQKTVDFNKIPLLIEISNEYPIAFDIIWALSFNQAIQKQLRFSTSFMSKLSHLEKASHDEQMRKIIHGILWNLEIKHEDHSTSKNNDGKTFDIMISYSHKEKTLCKNIYEELSNAGYRVWVDFDQMHGNVMDAMAQAIDRSHTIIICMSEEYRKSNYCRAEAHYAFQRQRKIVPVLLQKHYKPDGWLLFLIGQLLYVDFNKHEFVRAMEMLFIELKAEDSSEIKVAPIHPKEDEESVVSITPAPLSKAMPSSTLPHNIFEWTQSQVQQWLVEHNLIQMSHLLIDYDGRSLVYLNKYMERCSPQQILSLLQEDSLRRTNKSISLIEIPRFQSLMDQQTFYI